MLACDPGLADDVAQFLPTGVLDHADFAFGEDFGQVFQEVADLVAGGKGFVRFVFGVADFAEGAEADLTVFDPDESYVFTEDMIRSRSHNSPFIGRKLYGSVKMTFLRGEAVWRENGFKA